MKFHSNHPEEESEQRHLLLTGFVRSIANSWLRKYSFDHSSRHEDGSIQFWDITNISMPLLYKLKTSDYFQVEQAPIDDTEEETWPPFRKVILINDLIRILSNFFDLDGSFRSLLWRSTISYSKIIAMHQYWNIDSCWYSWTSSNLWIFFRTDRNKYQRELIISIEMCLFLI